MDRPCVTVHAMVSVDGRFDHFAGDVGLYYALAAELPHDAVLTGSATLLAAASAEGIDMSGEDEPVPAIGGNKLPWLVIVDSGGRVTRFGWLRTQPYWRDIIVLAADTTPPSHLDLLRRREVEYLVVGERRVDLAAALSRLSDQYGITRVRVDSGGTLNGALLRAGLVDELNLLMAPYAVGGRSARGLFVCDDLSDGVEVTRLELISIDRPPSSGETVWLRYRVRRG